MGSIKNILIILFPLMLPSVLSTVFTDLEQTTSIMISGLLAVPLVELLCSITSYLLISVSWIHRWTSENYIVINHDSNQYPLMITFLNSKYKKNIKGLKNSNQNQDNFFLYDIVEFKKSRIIDYYFKNNKRYKIMIEIKNNTTNNNSNNSNNKNDDDNSHHHIKNECLLDIVVKSKTNIKIIKEYIKFCCDIVKKHQIEILGKKRTTLEIYKRNTKKKKDKHGFIRDRSSDWILRKNITNKNLNNIFPSDDVKKNFIDDLILFSDSENLYSLRGLPYKRGYILYGEPGTGKSTLLKVLAAYLEIPIFILNISDKSYCDHCSEIYKHVKLGKLYMIILEDIDKASCFRWEIGSSRMLNLLDGIEESHGRIFILTTNNLKSLSSEDALIRPGRIDKIVNVTHCDNNQIINIHKHFIDNFDENNFILNKNIKVTPATLVKNITVAESFYKTPEDIQKICLLALNGNNDIDKIIHNYDNVIINENKKINLEECDNPESKNIIDDPESNINKKKKRILYRSYRGRKIDNYEIILKILNHKIDTHQNVSELKQYMLEKIAIECELDKLYKQGTSLGFKYIPLEILGTWFSNKYIYYKFTSSKRKFIRSFDIYTYIVDKNITISLTIKYTALIKAKILNFENQLCVFCSDIHNKYLMFSENNQSINNYDLVNNTNEVTKKDIILHDTTDINYDSNLVNNLDELMGQNIILQDIDNTKQINKSMDNVISRLSKRKGRMAKKYINSSDDDDDIIFKKYSTKKDEDNDYVPKPIRQAGKKNDESEDDDDDEDDDEDFMPKPKPKPIRKAAKKNEDDDMPKPKSKSEKKDDVSKPSKKSVEQQGSKTNNDSSDKDKPKHVFGYKTRKSKSDDDLNFNIKSKKEKQLNISMDNFITMKNLNDCIEEKIIEI